MYESVKDSLGVILSVLHFLNQYLPRSTMGDVHHPNIPSPLWIMYLEYFKFKPNDFSIYLPKTISHPLSGESYT